VCETVGVAGGLVTVEATAAGPANVAAATSSTATVRAAVRACGRKGVVDSIVGQGTQAGWTPVL
jgi:hypothetical protein